MPKLTQVLSVLRRWLRWGGGPTNRPPRLQLRNGLARIESQEQLDALVRRRKKERT